MIKGPLLIARYPGDERIEKQLKEARQRLIVETYRAAKPITPVDKPVTMKPRGR